MTTDMSDLADTQAGWQPYDGEGPPTTVIEPKSGWLGIDLRELWHYRELLYFLVWRDFKARYKQSLLGIGWAVIRPLVSMVIFSLIFGKLANMPSDGVPYPIFSYAGLLPWTLFAGATTAAAVSVVAQSTLLTKIYFPRLYIPVGNVGVTIVDFAMASLVYVGIMIYFQYAPGWLALLLPVLILLTLMASLGVGLILASLSVTYRDFQSVTPFLMQTWMYLSPVVFPISIVPDGYRWILALNPMTGIINSFRSALLGTPMDWSTLAISATVSVTSFFFGLYYFRRFERRFADVV
jgi:lipopolysaccharide transport system permease protein